MTEYRSGLAASVPIVSAVTDDTLQYEQKGPDKIRQSEARGKAAGHNPFSGILECRRRDLDNCRSVCPGRLVRHGATGRTIAGILIGQYRSLD